MFLFCYSRISDTKGHRPTVRVPFRRGVQQYQTECYCAVGFIPRLKSWSFAPKNCNVAVGAVGCTWIAVPTARRLATTRQQIQTARYDFPEHWCLDGNGAGEKGLSVFAGEPAIYIG
jgi:hypothetical protein